MTSFASGVSPHCPQQLLRSLHTNNQNNNGLIGDGSHNIVNSGNGQVNITQVATPKGEDVELDRLLDRHVSKDALRNSFHSPPECHPNTRTTIRDEIGCWLDESVSEKSPLLWLNGPAAVGKSVIAKTVSGFYDQIVATFFFSTSSDKTAATLFPTLAWQLARRIPDTRKHIIASLKSSNSLQTSQIEEQFDLLIIQPLKSTTTLRCRPVMVIDGVDECTDERMLGRFLRVLVQAGEGGDMPVRFIICSRPEPRIHAILGVNPTRDGPEPRRKPKEPRPELKVKVPRQLENLGVALSVALFVVFGVVGSLVLIRMFGIHQFHLFLLESFWRYSRFFGFPGQFAGLLGILASEVSGSNRICFRIPIQGRGFLQHVWELYRPIRPDVDKDAHSFPTSSSDRLDTICHYPMISTIRIGLSQECKDDMTRYLTDKFNAIRQPGDGQSPWFQPSDISDLVEASCGQFLYASTFVRLLDDPYFSPTDLLKMARRSSLPTPDLDELYKAILKRAQEGSPGYQPELGFVKDSLAILVFFAGDLHFLGPVYESLYFDIIEFLLGLEKGELNNKLCKMHSVLCIVPGKSVGVYHRSFLEFLLDHKRSGGYHIAYSNGLQRILILTIRAEFRYHIMWFLGQSRDETVGLVHGMIFACRHMFYTRSRFSRILFCLHAFFHLLICYLLDSFLRFHLNRLVQLSNPYALLNSTLFPSLLGAFIISLTIYTFFLNRSIIVPFFHPFLHPLFSVFTAGFLPAFYLLFLFLVNCLLFVPFFIAGRYF
ncbi:hypothetical protein M378DRAFT_28656 [Amanita muscaria Koide BX008]|uniref:Nephrocystin 3-like N-terminal domain-containing protein n=1 Tax=Amanita muscaria (strain Koide BX008) TaxID=946122 RepID=A0A0C2WDY8_AMAMK|nr:hypothetical protein M378DRAFT_28656 [Amanita muscaria Koide BX008]